jgi:N-methylhydantoinase A
MSLSVRMGIDVGGTFTDGVVLDGESRLQVAKVATTPGDLTDGFLEALTALERERGL